MIPTITTNIINLNFASDMLHFIWPWAWRKRNITGRCKKGFIAVMKSCETPSPIILWSQLSCCLGMDVSHGLTNLCIQQKLKVIICYPAKKLSTNWYLHRHWHKIIWHVYKELKSKTFILPQIFCISHDLEQKGTHGSHETVGHTQPNHNWVVTWAWMCPTVRWQP